MPRRSRSRSNRLSRRRSTRKSHRNIRKSYRRYSPRMEISASDALMLPPSQGIGNFLSKATSTLSKASEKGKELKQKAEVAAKKAVEKGKELHSKATELAEKAAKKSEELQKQAEELQKQAQQVQQEYQKAKDSVSSLGVNLTTPPPPATKTLTEDIVHTVAPAQKLRRRKY